ncbi:MAG: Rne/Rng family ribonuclease [Actinomycetota bacterium]|nr:Rne/Rng family ribonuclease [Actinomycetota bacterium]
MSRKRKGKPKSSKPQPPKREMAIGAFGDETRIAVMERGVLQEIFVGHEERRSIVGDICMGKVQNVLPGMEAAFIDIGHNRNALLYVGDIFQNKSQQHGRSDITKILKVGQDIMVQVTKDPMGGKGARLTSYLSIPGRYLVLLPQVRTVGISHRLDENQRARLRKIVDEVRPKDIGLIVRTAAKDAQADELRKSLSYLFRVWKQVRRAADKKHAPATLYREPELEIKVIRDVLDASFDRILVDNHRIFRRVRHYLKQVAPELMERVIRYSDETPLFDALDINRQIREALRRVVPLPSGGSIVIDNTEALTAIDVNTGRYIGKKSLEETVLRTNIEAVSEVVRQLRLRDIGGIIVIDFIDMNEAKNRRAVLKALNQELEKDRTKTYVVELTKLGLVEMTRKNVSEGLIEVFGENCPECHGRGIIFREP